MTRIVVSAFSLSLDGFAAGPNQSLQDPLGQGGLALHSWFFNEKAFPAMRGTDPAAEIDARMAQNAMTGFGAFILGRHMFGPQRGPWPDDGWQGWWGANPPWHAPTFILTHHPRPPLEMEGGTTYHFVTGGIQQAVALARQAAGPLNVKIGGGVSTIRQFLLAGLVDDLQLSISPILLGQGESLLTGIDLKALGFTVTDRAVGTHALHLTFRRSVQKAAE